MEDLVDLSTRATVGGTGPDEVLPDIDAHGYLVGVYRGTIEPNGSRLKAAIAALPFERPKLAVTAITTTEDLATRLEAAIAATGKVIDARPAPIEKPTQWAKPTSVEPLVTPEDMAKPMTRLAPSRFRGRI